MEKLMIPREEDDISCHLQQVGMGTLVCRAARLNARNSTNEVTPNVCFNCPAGRIFREIGCDSVLPKLQFLQYLDQRDPDVLIEQLFCKIRKRPIDIDYCRKCSLTVAETTRSIVSSTKGLFSTHNFYAAYRDLEKAREAIRNGEFDSAVTRSVSCVESTMKICHEKLGKLLPDKKQLPDLWKSTRELLGFKDLAISETAYALVNSLSGVMTNLQGLRDALSDAHGRGLYPPEVSESVAELALNTAATLATVIVRRFNQIGGEKDGGVRNQT